MVGNQPALQVHVKTATDEKERIARSIMQQKIGNNPRTMKGYDEHNTRKKETKRHNDQYGENESRESEEGDKVLLKPTRIVAGCKVRWARSF